MNVRILGSWLLVRIGKKRERVSDADSFSKDVATNESAGKKLPSTILEMTLSNPVSPT